MAGQVGREVKRTVGPEERLHEEKDKFTAALTA
jgi:hypothetical protein